MTNALPAKTAPETGERLRPLWIPRAECINVKTALAMFRNDYQLSEDTLRFQSTGHRHFHDDMLAAELNRTG
ncbi:MAG: hypothetical protein E5X43_06750 [Mesorhizobium sp.]|nr:MAG: hypothetical protein E5X43_06750 [Mesorhizobium sp.]